MSFGHLQLVFVSPVRSGPVFWPKIEGPIPGPVHLYPRTQKDRTGPMKTGLIGLFRSMDRSFDKKFKLV